MSLPSKFDHYPGEPTNQAASNAFLILKSSHESASSFLTIFEETRASRGAKGDPSDVDQDLLRAMLTFASSGLDSMVKQLIADTLPSVIDLDTGAQEVFMSYIERRLKRDEAVDHKFLARIIADKNPREVLVESLVYELTSNSLQSVDQLFRVASFFNIPSKDISSDPHQLREIFKIRNYIAHEMDVDLSQANRNRRPRRKQEMINNTNVLFEVSKAFLEQVDNRLSSSPWKE